MAWEPAGREDVVIERVLRLARYLIGLKMKLF